MSEIVKSERDLTTTYTGLRILKNKGAFNSCGFGVRDRASLSVLDTTYFCTAYQPVGGGVPIKYVKFYIGAGTTTSGDIVAAWWYRDAGDDTLHLVDSKNFPKPAAHWVTGTEYLYELDNEVRLPVVAHRTYYMSIYSQYCQFEATNVGAVRGVTGSGNSAASSSLAPGSQTDDNLAVSFESWGNPVEWERVENGGGIEEENTDWQTVTYCTGDMTNPTNIYGGPGVYATSGGNNKYIALDLGAGITPSTSLSGDEFPDYATSGIRAVSTISARLTLAAGGIIAVLSNDTDSATLPDVTGAGWTLLGKESYVSSTPVSFEVVIPTLARWILIVELGTSATDQIEQFEVNQIKTKVTDGNFPVSFLNAYHKCWTKNSPIEDTVYKVQCYNASGAVSEAGDPFTNRKYKD